MPGGDITKRHRWPDGDPRPGVGAAHDARRIIANGIQARQRLAVLTDDLGLGVGSNAGEGTKLAGNDANRVERRRIEGCDRWIGSVVGGTVEALIGIRAALKLRVLAVARRALKR